MTHGQFVWLTFRECQGGHMHVQAHHQFYIAVTDCQPASPLLGDSQEISENQDTCSKRVHRQNLE